MSMDHRRFLGFGAAFAAAPLATGCSDHAGKGGE
jgi:hypothetical protein